MLLLRYMLGTLSFMVFACSGCDNDKTAQLRETDSGPADSGPATVEEDTSSETDTVSNERGSDSRTAVSDTDTADGCAPDDDVFRWKPLPEGVDCGEGCRQLTFEEINSVTGWHASERYWAGSTTPGGQGVVVDLERFCISKPIIEPKGEDRQTRLTFPWVREDDVVFEGMWYGNGMMKHSILTINFGGGDWREYAANDKPVDERKDYAYVAGFDGGIVYEQGYEDERKSQLFLVDEESGIVSSLTEPGLGILHVSASDDYVVWMDVTKPYTDIWGYEIKTKKMWNLSDLKESDQLGSKIDGARVVWADLRNGSSEYGGTHEHSDIYLYDMESRKLRRITDGKWIQECPDISGDWIVYQDRRNAGNPNHQYDFSQVDIYLHDLNTGEDRQVTSFDGSETEPQIAGNKLFYFRKIPGEELFGVFMQDLTVFGFGG